MVAVVEVDTTRYGQDYTENTQMKCVEWGQVSSYTKGSLS